MRYEAESRNRVCIVHDVHDVDDVDKSTDKLRS